MLYQPIVDLRSGALAKVEALARLRLRDGRLIGPSEFLPHFARRELAELFRQGLEQALSSLRAWDALGLPLDVCVNLPPSLLALESCVDWVDDALRRHGVAASRLSLELLEHPFEHAAMLVERRALDRLRGLGVSLAMDDFGSGHSDLRRLAAIPFDALKVDQELTRLFASDSDAGPPPPRARTRLRRLLRRLPAEVVVEGVEDCAALAAARKLGAGFAQGFGIARPMPWPALPAWAQDFATRRCAHAASPAPCAGA